MISTPTFDERPLTATINGSYEPKASGAPRKMKRNHVIAFAGCSSTAEQDTQAPYYQSG